MQLVSAGQADGSAKPATGKVRAYLYASLTATADLYQHPIIRHSSTAAPLYLYPWHMICQITFASVKLSIDRYVL